MASRGRRRLLISIATLAVLVALVVRWRWYPGQAFDPVAWRDEPQVENGVRLDMADRLVARRTLSGMTRAEVIELLGEPTKTAKFGDWDLVYWLGPERMFFSIDSEWLVIRFNADGVVTESHIVRD